MILFIHFQKNKKSQNLNVSRKSKSESNVDSRDLNFFELVTDIQKVLKNQMKSPEEETLLPQSSSRRLGEKIRKYKRPEKAPIRRLWVNTAC